MNTCCSVQSHAHATVQPIGPHRDMWGDGGMAFSTNGDFDDAELQAVVRAPAR